VSQGPPEALRPDVEVDLEWLGEDRVRARAGAVEITMDSPPVAGPSPVQTLAMALAACMAMDVLVVMKRGRHALQGLRVRLVAERAASEPRRILKADLHFTLSGEVPEDRVARALSLSRDKYCSVWHSMRPDIELTTSFELIPPPPARSGAGLTPA
jgi:putative redox protein